MINRDTLLDRIRRLDKLTVSESKIADLFERNYPLVALDTVTSISDKAEVGKATVVRFIARLGYANFNDFQEKQQRELVRRLVSPYGRLSESKACLEDGNVDFLRQYINIVNSNLKEAHARLDPEQLLEAAKIMAECPGSVYVTGQGESHSIAYLFWNQAMYIRKRVQLLDNLTTPLPLRLIDVSADDVLFAIARERYGHLTNRVCAWFAAQGAKVILLTDREVTPSAESAHIQLVVRSEGPIMFNTNCPRLAVVECLTGIMSTLLEEQIDQRSERCEDLFDDFSIFMPWNYETQPGKQARAKSKPDQPKKDKDN